MDRLYILTLKLPLTENYIDASRFLAQSQLRSSVLRDAQRHFTGSTHPAPLFFSTADFPAEDREHEQEILDYYALKSSRRHFGVYADSSSENGEGQGNQSALVVKDIKSSWDPRSSHESQPERERDSHTNSIEPRRIHNQGHIDTAKRLSNSNHLISSKNSKLYSYVSTSANPYHH